MRQQIATKARKYNRIVRYIHDGTLISTGYMYCSTIVYTLLVITNPSSMIIASAPMSVISFRVRGSAANTTRIWRTSEVHNTSVKENLHDRLYNNWRPCIRTVCKEGH